MDNAEQTTLEPQKPKKKRDRVRVFLVAITGMLVCLLALQIVFFYYSDKLFGQLLKEVVYQQSDGVYSVDYEKIKFNFLANQIEITEVHIIPDRPRFQTLFKDSLVGDKLFEIRSPAIIIQGPSLLKLYFDEELDINECVIESAFLQVEVFGQLSGNVAAYKNFHKVISKYLKRLLVKEFRIENAFVEVVNRHKKGGDFNINDMSIAVSNLEIERELLRPDSIFSIGNLEFFLGKNNFKLDSNNNLAFDSLHLSLADSSIVLSKLAIIPIAKGDFNTIKLLANQIYFEGLNFRKVYFDDELRSRLLRIEGGDIRYDQKQKRDPEELYELLKPFFAEVKIKEIAISKLDLHYNQQLTGVARTINLPIQAARLYNFNFDSITFVTRRKKFFADYLDIQLNNYRMDSRDSIHSINAGELYISTKRNELIASNITIKADSASNRPMPNSLVGGSIESVQLFGFDIWLFIDQNRLYCRALTVSDPSIRVRQMKENVESNGFSQQPFKKALLAQFNSINISNLELENASFRHLSQDKKLTKLSGLDLFARDFNVNNETETKAELLFCENFVMSSNRFSQIGAGQNLQIENPYVNSEKGFLSFDKLDFEKSIINKQDPKVVNADLKLALKKMKCTGVDIHKLIYHQRLEGNQVEISGNNQLTFDSYVSATQGRWPITKIQLNELYVDSFSSAINGEEKGFHFSQGGSIIQLCELKWDSTQTLGRFSAYAVNVNGKRLNMASKEKNHNLRSSNFRISSNYNIIEFNKLNIAPIDPARSNIIHYKSAKVQFTEANVEAFFADNELIAKAFYSEKPQIRLRITEKPEFNAPKFQLENLYPLISGAIAKLDIENVRFLQGKAFFEHRIKGKSEFYKADEFTFYLNYLFLDSITRMDHRNLLYSQKSELSLDNFTRYSSDSTLLLKSDKLVLSPHDSLLRSRNIILNNFVSENKINHFQLTVEELNSEGVDFYSLIDNNSIELRKIGIKKPELTMGVGSDTVDREVLFRQTIPETFMKNFSLITVKKFNFDQGVIRLISHKNSTKRTETVGKWKGNLEFLRIDTNYSILKTLYASSGKISLYGYSKTLPDSINRLELGLAEIDLEGRKMTLKEVKFQPKVSKQAYGKTIGFESDCIEVNNAESELTGFNIESFLYDGNIKADKLFLGSTIINAYRDKNDSAMEQPIKPMPQLLLRKLPFKIHIPQIAIENWDITYEEVAVGQTLPGSINFNHFNATITGLTNVDTLIRSDNHIMIDIQSAIMKSGEMHVTLDVPLFDENDAYSFKGSVTEGMDLREINPMLIRLAMLSIRSGETSGLTFNGNADRYIAEGRMTFLYSKLQVDVLKPEGKKKFFTVVANTLLPNNNGKLFPREGKIFYERDATKSIFNYGAKSVISGVKSTLGI